jgi:hypothetical protein
MRRHLRNAGVALGLIACGLVAWFSVHYVVQARDQGTAGTVLGALAAVLVPLAGLAVWLVHRLQPEAPPVDLGWAAAELARRVGLQWEEAASLRFLSQQPLDVRWTWSTRRLTGTAEAAVGVDSAPRNPPLDGLDRIETWQLNKGSTRDLFKIYGGLDSGRLILAGAPGAGKSGAMIRLLLAAVKHRKGIGDPAEQAKVPVPVLLTAYDWLPESELLDDWLTRRLEDEHPFLKAKAKDRPEPSAARALVNDHLISILLDGVDEMQEGARIAVLREIDLHASCRVVVSCRTSELELAVRDGWHLTGAAALELAPITSQEAADYLKDRTVASTPGPWGELIQYLRENQASQVAQALNSPLMLSLLLDTYQNRDPVNELIEGEKRVTDHKQLEEHLLGRALDAAYAPRSGGQEPSWPLPQARRRLGYLAAQMEQAGTSELAWWRVRDWLPSRHLKISIGLASALLNGLLSGLSFGVATGIVFGRPAGLGAGLAVGLVSGTAFGITAGLAFGWPVGLRAGLAIGSATGIEVGLAAGILGGLKFGRDFGLTDGLTVGITVALAVALTIWLTTEFTGRHDATDRNRFPPQYRGLWGRDRLAFGHIASGLAVGIAIGTAAGGLLGLAAAFAVGLKFGLGTGFAGGIAGGIAGGLASGLTRGLNLSVSADKLITPMNSFRGNHRLVLAIEVAVGVAVGVATGAAFGIAVWISMGPAAGIAAGVASGIAVGVTSGIAAGATDVNFFLPACVAFVLMRRSGGPARMLGFLEDARRRGVLRTAGPVYQFRHARLQDLLASQASAIKPQNGESSAVPDATSILSTGHDHSGNS